ncbi:V-type proton ATPase subunit G 2 [Capsicum chinense]|nr:V-type proton ATPase subunit G 2 [Capsicum chinense]
MCIYITPEKRSAEDGGEKRHGGVQWSAVELIGNWRWTIKGELLEYGVVGFVSTVYQTSMESSRGNQNGIQQLLSAEQEAQHIVNAARSAKQARLKQAKDEAEKEIAEFRAYMEAEFQRKVEQTSGDSGANVKRLDQETFAKIQNLKAESESISNDVVQMLLRQVTTVKN